MSIITTVKIVINSLADTLQFFNRIEVYRSTTVDTGPFFELTDVNGPLPAIVDGTNTGPFNLHGLSLSLTLDGAATPTVIAFTDTDPIGLADVITKINSVVDGLALEVPTSTNRLRLNSTTEGTGSSLIVAAGSAATALGLATTKANGKERRIRIVNPTTMYQFVDRDGQNDFWYKYRFSNTDNVSTSDFSIPQQGSVDVVVPSEQLVKGTLNLVDGLGRPVVGRRIIFIPGTSGVVPTTSFHIVPGFDARVEVLTNELGYAEANLLRGITYRMILEGTSLMREFITPTSGGPFDLMTIASTAPDPFDIATVPPRPFKVTI